jgi:hypothetical protein
MYTCTRQVTHTQQADRTNRMQSEQNHEACLIQMLDECYAQHSSVLTLERPSVLHGQYGSSCGTFNVYRKLLSNMKTNMTKPDKKEQYLMGILNFLSPRSHMAAWKRKGRRSVSLPPRGGMTGSRIARMGMTPLRATSKLKHVHVRWHAGQACA